jgi:hypothetical protein
MSHSSTFDERDGSELRNSTLAIALSAAVPMAIDEMKKLSWEERQSLARECQGIMIRKGESILYAGAKGDTATAFAAWARGIAILSFCPGGVDVFGMHFETKEEKP